MQNKLVDVVQGIPIVSSHGFLGWSSVSIMEDREGYVLFDTGGYNNKGALINALRNLKIDFKQVRKVLVTHLHFDHCMNVDLFPNATLYVGKREIDYALSEEPDKVGDIFVPKPYIREILRRHDVVEVKDGDKLGNNVKVVELPGHTPGCVGYLINESIIFTGDALRNTHELIYKIPSLCFGGEDAWRRSIEKITSIAKVIIPGHERRLIIEDSEVKYLTEGKEIAFKFVIKGKMKEFSLNPDKGLVKFLFG